MTSSENEGRAQARETYGSPVAMQVRVSHLLEFSEVQIHLMEVPCLHTVNETERDEQYSCKELTQEEHDHDHDHDHDHGHGHGHDHDHDRLCLARSEVKKALHSALNLLRASTALPEQPSP
jgi:ABC-type Zn2+ transport system substrate-binding protein/surface adhesin